MEIYVLFNPKTGDFWQKNAYNRRRGVYAYKSPKKAEASAKMSNGPEAVVKKFRLVEE